MEAQEKDSLEKGTSPKKYIQDGHISSAIDSPLYKLSFMKQLIWKQRAADGTLKKGVHCLVQPM